MSIYILYTCICMDIYMYTYTCAAHPERTFHHCLARLRAPVTSDTPYPTPLTLNHKSQPLNPKPLTQNPVNPTLPCPALPSTLHYPTVLYRAVPYRTLPYPTLPYPTSTYPSLPNPTLPYPTLSYHTLLHPALPQTLNPNPRPQSLDPKPETRNPHTLNTQPTQPPITETANHKSGSKTLRARPTDCSSSRSNRG